MTLGMHLFVLAAIFAATLFALFGPRALVRAVGIVLFAASLFLSGAFVALFAV